jgi:hypothetical protein
LKVTFEWPFKTYSGTQDEMTYMSYCKGHLCLGRGWEKQDNTANNARLAHTTQNLKNIWDNANQAYKEDVKQYARKFKAQKLKRGQYPPAAFAIFLRMIYGWQRSLEEQVDLSTLTVEEIVIAGSPARSVALAVGAQLLTPVSGYELLGNVM